jgi:hypothetical protein
MMYVLSGYRATNITRILHTHSPAAWGKWFSSYAVFQNVRDGRITGIAKDLIAPQR